MKKISQTIILLFLVMASRGQENTSHIGIGLIRLTDVQSSYGCSPLQKQAIFPMTYTNCPFLQSQTSRGASLFFTTKIYKNLQARINYHFIRIKSEFYTDYGYADVPTYRSHQYEDHNLGIGLQYNIIPHRKLSPYFITEFANQILSSNKKYYDEQDNLVKSTEGDSYYAPGFAVGFGLRYSFAKNFSASIESMPNGVGMDAYPLSRLSVNYHF